MKFFPHTWNKSQAFNLGFSLHQLTFLTAVTFRHVIAEKACVQLTLATTICGSGAAKGDRTIINVINHTFAFS